MLGAVVIKARLIRGEAAPKPVSVRAFVNVREAPSADSLNPQGRYTPIAVVARDEEMSAAVLRDAERGLRAWARKYQAYRGFAAFGERFGAILEALEVMEEAEA